MKYRSRCTLALVCVICGVSMAVWFSSQSHDWVASVPAQSTLTCLSEMTPDVRASLPEYALYQLKDGTAVVACYKSGDIVCDTIRRNGGFEPNLVQIMRTAATTLSTQHRLAVSLLQQRDAHLAACVARGKGSSVAYVDVGGNVGAFALSMMSHGFDTTVFEAMPANHALLTLSSCLSMGRSSGAGRWELHHVALGPGGGGASDECVILSSDTNVGDGTITCDRTTVQQHRAALDVKKPLKQFRSMVQLSSLDSQLFTANNNVRGLLAYEAATCVGALTERSPSCTAKKDNNDSYYVRRSKPVVVSESWPTDRLARFVARRPVVMKIDVEGFEHMVMQGASAFLASAVTKPTVLLSEVWLWKPEIREYICELIMNHEYSVYFVELDRWVRFAEDVRRITRTYDKIGNAVFVQPGYEYLLETTAEY